MASEWWFYHLDRPPLAAALAPLFEKCLERDWRVLVVSPSQEVLDEIDKDLWTFRDDSFLPHGRDIGQAELQPVLLSSGAQNQNGAKVLVLLNGEGHDPKADFERVMVVFEDGDTHARGEARRQYAAARKAGLSVRYFQQTGQGGWKENKA
ncbi:DNA polymerase III subunit chi [Ponticaulis profundi]|uniref:DNA polymerase III subunit chi n=1 Tax=Ponticaulis profundi TaxID=2665222 RepID=A0ABW1SDF0_9PROT